MDNREVIKVVEEIRSKIKRLEHISYNDPYLKEHRKKADRECQALSQVLTLLKQLESITGGMVPEEKKTLPRGLGSPYNPAQSKINGYNICREEVKLHILKVKERLEKVKDNLMYDFPKSFTNSQIVAYQRVVNKVAKAILTEMNGER